MQRSGHATTFNFRHLKIVCLQLHLCDTPAYGQTVKNSVDGMHFLTFTYQSYRILMKFIV